MLTRSGDFGPGEFCGAAVTPSGGVVAARFWLHNSGWLGGGVLAMCGIGAALAQCFMVMQVRDLPQIICPYGVCMFNSVKAMLCSEPTTVTPVGATNPLGGVVEMLISPPFAQLRRKLCF